LDKWKNKGKKLKVIWVDGGFEGSRAKEYAKEYGIELEVVKRKDSKFKILPQRWIVERTFAWLGKFRRLSKDYELYLSTAETMIYTGMVRNMVRRLVSL
jgi:putative transposase